MNESKTTGPQVLVSLAQSMLEGKLSFFEGAVKILAIKNMMDEIEEKDPDFDAFVIIRSETDHLPLHAQHQQWAPKVLNHLEPEFQRTEEWARSFAPQACKNLIIRFGGR